VWVAETFGCHVTGINIAPLQLLVARQLAKRRGVANLCEFRVLDMDALDLDTNSVDLVVNQETFCHAADKHNYLHRMHRSLKPGGNWRAIDFGVAGAELSPRQARWYRTVCDGFAVPSFLPSDRTAEIAHELGFVEWSCVDLTPQVLPTARLIMRGSLVPVVLARLRLDWLRFPGDPTRRARERGHFEAGMAYSRGLLKGYFRHYLYAARKAAAG